MRNGQEVAQVSTVTAGQLLLPAGSQPIFANVLRPKWIKRPGPEAGYTPTVPNEGHNKVELQNPPPPLTRSDSFSSKQPALHCWL
jgi:hypothetical protein